MRKVNKLVSVSNAEWRKSNSSLHILILNFSDRFLCVISLIDIADMFSKAGFRLHRRLKTFKNLKTFEIF